MGLDALGTTGRNREEPADRPSSPIDLSLLSYARVASLALRAEDLARAETPSGERPFVGYDRERAAYARFRPELLERADGQYVVLVGDEIEGPFDTFEEALRAGWQRFGLGPLYVKQIGAEEPADENPSCRS
jgi:hypothetical protein